MGAIITSRPVRRVLKWGALTTAFFAGVLMAVVLVFAGHAEDQQSTLAKLISQMLSSKSSTVSIGSVDGPLSSNTTIRNVAIADKNGVWLKVDRVRLVWSRLALLQRRLEVDTLEIGKLDILRKPFSPPGDKAAASNEPLLPELPVKVNVKSFKLGELSLGQELAGVAVKLTASGNLKLGAPSEGLDVALNINRLDGDAASRIKLLFIPKGERLTLDVAHREAKGGVLARLASIPGLPSVSLQLQGEGPLDRFTANLDFDAGNTIGAKGKATVLRSGAARRITLDIDSRIEGLIPPIAAAIFAGTTTVKGDALIGDDGSMILRDFRLGSQLAELLVSGKLDTDKQFDFSILSRALANDNGATRRGNVRIGKLNFKTRARGTFDKPVVEGSFEARNYDSPAGGLASATAEFSVKPAAGDKLAIVADAQIRGIRSAQKGLAAAVGETVSLTIRAALDDKGKVDIAQSRIASPVYDVNYTGVVDAGKISGNVEGRLFSLAALSQLTGRSLKGQARLNADIAGDTKKQTWDIGLRSQATGLSLGDAMLNRIAGGALAIKGRVKSSPDVLTLENVSAIARGFEAQASGSIAKHAEFLAKAKASGEQLKGLALQIVFADAHRIDPRLRGAAQVTGQLVGALDNPDGSIELRGARMSAAGKPIRDVSVRLDGKRLLGALEGKLTASGQIDGRSLRGDGLLAKRTDGGWEVSGLDVALGSARVAGAATVAAGGLTSGSLSVKAPDLRHLSALLLTSVRGSLNADVQMTAANGKQNATVKADARGIVYQTLRIGTAQANIDARDVLARPAVAGDIRAAQLRIAGETIGRLTVTASSNGSETGFVARASGGSISLNGEGAFRNGKTASIYLKTLSVVRRGIRIALAAPATMQLVDGGIRTTSLTLVSSGGRIALSGLAGSRFDLKAAITNLPLSLARAANPKLKLDGRLRATADIKGSVTNPRGNYSIAISGLATPETRSAGLPRLNINIAGQLQGQRVSVRGDVRGGSRIGLRLDGAVPLDNRGALALGIKGTVDAALANASLAGTGQRVTGKLALDMRVGGTTAQPSVSGSGSLRGGTFRDPLQGVSLRAITGRFSGRGDKLTIDSLSASTAKGGRINVAGTIGVNPAGGFPANLRITAAKAQLVSNEIMTLVAGLNLYVTGPLTQDPVLRGQVTIRSLNVEIPTRLPASAAPLRGAKHIAPPAQTRARLKAIAAARRAAARRKRSKAAGPRIDVRIDAPNQVFVRGRGIDAELGGTLRVAGTINAPRANGAFEIRRGRIDLLTQRIDFTRGKLTFLGDIIPELDFIASTSASGVTANINITGRADNPKIGFSSQPVMASDEVMSYLLFKKAAASLKPFEAVQLAAAVATLTGNSGPGILEKARRALGVDTLDVNAGGPNGPSVGASRYISKRISVGVTAGTTPANSAATVKFDLSRRIKLLGSVTGDGNSSVGIGTEIEY
ncbi:MAG: translocation/assembly module TamB domain-containing protein [Hyphomicrobiales bacterium]|nr:translocation/assembly module TamB domain-containing protein [Hyphomicrobiales bacterium]